MADPIELWKAKQQEASSLETTGGITVTVGEATCEYAAGSGEVREVFMAALASGRIKIDLESTGCTGRCYQEPIIRITGPENRVYTYLKVTPAMAREIIEKHLRKGNPIKSWMSKEVPSGKKVGILFDDMKEQFSLKDKQQRIVLRNAGIINPEKIEDYLRVRGYEALAGVLARLNPGQVIEEVKASGLRGRGGAGYPAGMKWELLAAREADNKYVICNADEGDPGAFMDRSAIESDPHNIIEGIIIGGFAVGARKGFIYLRTEYPLAVRRLEKAIAEAERMGFLGENILGTSFSFEIELRLSAGAYVCGEETALIHSIEGRRGMPTSRPPYPVEKGVFGEPSIVNNVETWANISAVILKGSEWFASIGTEKSKGTKVFSIAGHVKKTGLAEVPMGTSLRELVFDIAGGIEGGKKFKALLIGGPSGGCITEAMLDTRIDYETLSDSGPLMGSGGIIVLAEDSCMVHMARFFLEFTQAESCGKCTPCREGTKRMLEILERIIRGKGVEQDIGKLERLGRMIKRASLCGLGKSAPNPVLNTLKYFKEEYQEHILESRCRAMVCRSLRTYHIIKECVGCGVCKAVCPVKAISGIRKNRHKIDKQKCVKCGACLKACRYGAICFR